MVMVSRWLLTFLAIFAISIIAISTLTVAMIPKKPPRLLPGQTKRTPDQNLVKRILNSYNKEAMPERPLVVSLHVLLIKVKSTIEKEGIFESVVALFIEWKDKRMSWNPADFNNLTVLAFDPEQVWLPDIAMTNSADHLYSISRDSRFIVRVAHDGWLKFVPTGTARTWCELNLLTFPFDFQMCTLEFESWSLDSSTMTFDGKSQLLLDSGFGSCQFSLCEMKAVTYNHTYEQMGETFTRVEFSIIVKRKATFYIINLIFPCTTLSLIALLVFAIPSVDTTGDRIAFGTTNMLTLVVFQTIVTAEMPKTSDAVTALSKYIIALILISAVGIAESVIVERILAYRAIPPPRCLIRLMEGVPAFHSDHKNNSSTPDSDDEEKELRQIRKQQTTPVKNAVVMRNNGLSFTNNEVEADSNKKTKEESISQPTTTTTVNNNNNKNRVAFVTHSQSARNCCPGSISSRSASSTTSSSERMLPNSDGGSFESGKFSVNDSEAARVNRIRQRLRLHNNNRQWRLIAYKIDTISFTTCTALAILVPAALFLPLIIVSDNCSDDAKVLLQRMGQ